LRFYISTIRIQRVYKSSFTWLIIVYFSKDTVTPTSRVYFTLDYLGNVHASVLDGGLAKWKREGRPVAGVVAKVAKGAYTPKPRSELVVDAAWIQPRLGKPGTALIDTRTDGEYIGRTPISVDVLQGALTVVVP